MKNEVHVCIKIGYREQINMTRQNVVEQNDLHSTVGQIFGFREIIFTDRNLPMYTHVNPFTRSLFICFSPRILLAHTQHRVKSVDQSPRVTAA